jgi:hypothetical protein
MVPRRKLKDTAAEVAVKNSVGAALTAKSSRRPKRNVSRVAVNVMVPSHRLAGLVEPEKQSNYRDRRQCQNALRVTPNSARQLPSDNAASLNSEPRLEMN